MAAPPSWAWTLRLLSGAGSDVSSCGVFRTHEAVPLPSTRDGPGDPHAAARQEAHSPWVHDYVAPVKALSEPLFFHLITGGPADGAVRGWGDRIIQTRKGLRAFKTPHRSENAERAASLCGFHEATPFLWVARDEKLHPPELGARRRKTRPP